MASFVRTTSPTKSIPARKQATRSPKTEACPNAVATLRSAACTSPPMSATANCRKTRKTMAPMKYSHSRDGRSGERDTGCLLQPLDADGARAECFEVSSPAGLHGQFLVQGDARSRDEEHESVSVQERKASGPVRGRVGPAGLRVRMTARIKLAKVRDQD